MTENPIGMCGLQNLRPQNSTFSMPHIVHHYPRDGKAGGLKPKARVPVLGTRFHMSDLAVLPNMVEEPSQESIVTNGRTIAHHCNM